VRARQRGDLPTKAIGKVATEAARPQPNLVSATDGQPAGSIIEILRAADEAERLKPKWFVRSRHERHGPFSTPELEQAVARGLITAETRVTQIGWKKWHLAGQVEGLIKPQPSEKAERRSEELRPPVVRARLAEVASPAPSLTPDGRLDAGANPIYDAPTVNDDLPTLPIRQRNLIKTILAGLPRQTPAQLKVSLSNYTEELKARGVRPILGLLNDMVAVIEADVGAPDARREWLEPGMLKAFERFADNHALFAKHFPLDQQREELYQNTFVDEDQASGQALSKPFEDVAKATLDANRAGLTTDDFLKIVDKLTEFAKVTSTQPPLALSVSLHRSANAEDKSAQGAIRVSPKKRILLSAFGFFERVYNLLASTVTLAGPVEGNALLIALRNALAALSKLIGF